MKGGLTWPSRSYFFIEVELSIIELSVQQVYMVLKTTARVFSS